jgi:hypothetical protein
MVRHDDDGSELIEARITGFDMPQHDPAFGWTERSFPDPECHKVSAPLQSPMWQIALPDLQLWLGHCGLVKIQVAQTFLSVPHHAVNAPFQLEAFKSEHIPHFKATPRMKMAQTEMSVPPVD